MGMVRNVAYASRFQSSTESTDLRSGACHATRGRRPGTRRWPPKRCFGVATGLLVALLVVGCGGAMTPSSGNQMTFKFSEGSQGWTAGIADYNPNMEDIMMFVADYRPLPAPLTSSALFMSSANRSDDAFMFYKRQVLGLTPSTNYTATFTVTIATNEPHGCAGVGGAPGESVYFKAGATAIEPVRSIAAMKPMYEQAIAQSGANAVVLGDVADDLPCEPANLGVWRLKTLGSASNMVPVRSNPDGSVWLIVGTDSGFEGVTSLYITEVDVTFQKGS